VDAGAASVIGATGGAKAALPGASEPSAPVERAATGASAIASPWATGSVCPHAAVMASTMEMPPRGGDQRIAHTLALDSGRDDTRGTSQGQKGVRARLMLLTQMGYQSGVTAASLQRS
jgi:hypothetical protein